MVQYEANRLRVQNALAHPLETSYLGVAYLLKNKSDVFFASVIFVKMQWKKLGARCVHPNPTRLMKISKIRSEIIERPQCWEMSHGCAISFPERGCGTDDWTFPDHSRAMLLPKQLSKASWAQALAVAVYVQNRVTCSPLTRDKTLYHVLNKIVLKLGYISASGCRSWYTVPKKNFQKLYEGLRRASFVGYADHNKGC